MPGPVGVLEVGFGSAPDDPISSTVWTDIAAWQEGKVKIRRGRGDEQAELQPGSMSLLLDNSDGRFTAGRAGSPYWPNVKTGKRIRFGVMWPGGGKNYAENPTTDNAGHSQSWAAGGSVPPTLSITSEVAPQVGTHALKIVWGTGGVLPQANINIRGLVVGKTYTVSAYLRVPSGGSPAALLAVGGGPTGASTTVTDAWQRRTVTFTATANTHNVQVWPASAPTSGQVARVNALQVEDGPAATTFENTPGLFSWQFTGDVGQWPTAWQGPAGRLAYCEVSATDRFARLGETGEFRTFLEEDILDDDPVAYYPMADPEGSATAGGVSANSEPALTQAAIGAGGGSITFGGEAGVPTASPLTSVVFAPASAINGRYLTAPLPAATPAGTASIAAFVATTDTAATHKPIAALVDAAGNRLALYIDGVANHLFASTYDAVAGIARSIDSGLTINQGVAWFVSATLETPGGTQQTLRLFVNGVENNNRNDTYTSLFSFTNANVGTVRKSDPVVNGLFVGSLSHVAFYGYTVPGSVFASQWFTAFQGLGGSNTHSRTQRLADFLNLGTVFYTSYNNVFNPRPAGKQEIAGNPVDAFRAVERTEDGLLYLAGDGNIVLQLRNGLYNLTPAATVDAALLDPDALAFRGDDFGIVNDVTARRLDGAQVRAVNQASVADHGRRKASLDLVSGSDEDVASVAWWRANSRGTQYNRITGLRLNLLGDSATIAAVLPACDGRRWKLRITGLPTTQAPAGQVDVIVEGWDATIADDEWTMEFNTSPAEMFDVWQLGVPGHSELGTTTRLAEAT